MPRVSVTPTLVRGTLFVALTIWCVFAIAPQVAAEEGAHRVKVRILVGTATMTATLEDNTTARDFAKRLPLTLTLRDFGEAEKVSDALPVRLSVEGAPATDAGAAGDIAYYAPWRNIAFYRGRGPDAAGVVRIGRISSGEEVLNQPGLLQVTITRTE